MIKVAKFGGSSVADAGQFQKVKDIVLQEEERKFVVVSASGRRFVDDNKITDLLYLCHAHIKYTVNYEQVFQMIVDRFQQIKNDLHLGIDLDAEFVTIKESLSKNMNVDYLASRGEYLTAKLMAEYLGYPFVDAKDVICFDYHGKINYEKSQEAMDACIREYDCMVIPGFYGSMPDGAIKTLDRGGSDITGAIIARLVDASLYENWSDVSGILIADPRVVRSPKAIATITYSELRELSYMGASVLHEEAIFPVMERNIPINIRNTNQPSHPGTIIIDQSNVAASQDQIITGIAGKKDFSVITIYKNHMSNEVGMIRKALTVFEKYRINIEHIPSGIDSFSVVVASSEIKKNVYDIVVEIKQACDTDKVNVIHDMSLIATVGRNMVYRPGISGRLFATLGDHGINIRMIAQGSDEINIIIGVENKDFEKTIRVIYDNFVQETNQ